MRRSSAVRWRRRAPADPRFAQSARHRERSRRLALAGRQVAESQCPRRQGLPQALGRESVGDPVEERQRGLAGTAVGHRDAAGERAGDPRARARAPRRARDRSTRRCAGSRRRRTGSPPPECGGTPTGSRSPLRWRAAGAPLAPALSTRRGREPSGCAGSRRRDLPGNRARAGTGRVFGKEVQARARRRRAVFSAARRRTSSGVHVRPLRQRRRVADENGAELPELARSAKAEAGIASGAMPAARISSSVRWSARWRPGPFAQGAKIGARLQGLGAGLLDESQRLGAREEPAGLPARGPGPRGEARACEPSRRAG